MSATETANIMVVYSPYCLKTVTENVSNAIRNLVGKDSTTGRYQIKACCCCDRMIKYGECEFISKRALKSRKWALPDELLKPNINEYYTYKSKSSNKDKSLTKLILSPRSFYTEKQNGKSFDAGFEICRDCNSQKSPKFAIKNYPIGGAPFELTCLNEVELTLVSQGRIDRNIFQLYGGQHQCISMWHQMHYNDTEHTLASLEVLQEYKVPSVLMCTLSGPFTSRQKSIALKRISVDTSKVIRALEWLKANNILYKDLKVPGEDGFPVPVIIDNTEAVSDSVSRIETIFETTIVFPETNQIHENNGGNSTNAAFANDVIKDKRQFHMISRPTPNSVRLYEGTNLLKCFPLQFPYGTGARKEKVDILSYVKYIVDISIPSFQLGSFILPVFNLYAKTEAVRRASMRCKYKISETMNTGDVINQITTDELEDRISNLENKRRGGDRNTQRLIDSVYAISKKLPFTDEAASEERRKLFSMCTKFGLPSIFFTVTPDDLDNFRIRVYSCGSEEDCPISIHSNDDEIDNYLDECAEIRVKYPGYCAHDFDSILKIVIEHVIGWDLKSGTGKVNTGAFGDCEAWYTPVEEQGRKTLHSHFLIWIKGWSSILKGLYSVDMEHRETAAAELSAYADHVVSTRCFGIEERSNHITSCLGDAAVKHDCEKPEMKPCSRQKLRNMRYKFCERTKKETATTSCDCCKVQFTNEELVCNVMEAICNKLGVDMENKEIRKRMRLVLLEGNANLLESINDISDIDKDFLLQVLRNMHHDKHTFTCFKKQNDECRSRIPNPPCEKTIVHFLEDESILWHEWNGTIKSRTPYMLEVKRHPLDVFMNQYNPTTSKLLQSNTNVQLGIDGAHIMYCTCYACKSNKKEEKQSMIDACEGLLKRVKKELIDSTQEDEDGSTEAPTAIAFKRMFVSILSCTTDYVLSAPLAKYLIANDSRFLCSHEFTNLPFYDFKKGNSTEAKLHVTKNSRAFISSARDTYLFRPNILHSLSTSEYYSKYMTKNKSKKKNDDELQFLKDAPPGYKNLRCIQRDVATVPIIYHEMMEDAKTFGGNILCPNFHLEFPDKLGIAEDCAQKMLILFLPFRNESELTIDGSYLLRLRKAVNEEELAVDYEVMMQNMQDCRNSLNSGALDDMLERTTNPMEPSDDKEAKKKKKQCVDKKVRDHLDKRLSELIADITEAFEDTEGTELNRTVEEHTTFTLKHIRDEGSNDCGIGDAVRPKFDASPFDPFLEAAAEPKERRRKKQKTDHFPDEAVPLPSNQFLLEVKCSSVLRNIDIGDVDKRTQLENVNATGSIPSILAWSKIAFRDESSGEDDVDQQQAFQSIISDFVLTYLPKNYSREDNVQYSGENGNRSDRAEMLKWKRDLYRMRGLNSLKNKDNLIMFMTGAGGSGKSHVINNVLAYASKYCSTIKQPFDKRTIVVTAMTGVAATSILGETAHSALCLNISGGVQAKLHNGKGHEIIQQWKNARLVIIDEISFANKTTLKSIVTALEILKQNQFGRFGGISIVFTGDFLQLEPVAGDALFIDDSFEQWFDWINCFVELYGGHRFKDKSYMKLLGRMRSGTLTRKDFDDLDRRVVKTESSSGSGITMEDIPAGTQIACHYNKDRNAMNCAVFEEHLKKTHSTCEHVPCPSHTLIVKGSKLRWSHSERPLSRGAKYNLFNRCRDSDIESTTGKKFRDPLLKLFYRVPTMLTDNDDVPKGIANGTVGELDKIFFVHGGLSHMHKIQMDGYWVNCIESQYVEKLIFHHGKDLNLIHEVLPNEYNCNVDMPLNLMPELMKEERYNVKLKMYQFPILINHATTVHKLQGQTKKSLYVTNYSYQRNWVYVALSRVQTMDGLFLRLRLDRSKNFRPHGRLLAMLRHFATKTPSPFDEDDLR